MSDSAVRKKISLRLKGDGEHKASKESKPQAKTSHESHGKLFIVCHVFEPDV